MANWTVSKMARITPPHIPVPQQRKWVTLSNDNLSLMSLLDVDVDMLSGNNSGDKNIFTVGAIYSLGKDSVEGVEFDKQYFMLCGIVEEYKGYPLNSLIVREVSVNDDGTISDSVNGTGRRKFSIPPSMCKRLGIKYSPGFELWPMNSGFERVNLSKLKNRKKKINYGDMSTYPTSGVDGTIRKIILELHGFSAYNASHIITPTGAMIPTSKFVSSLTIFARQNISTDNGCAGFKMGEYFSFKIVTRDSGKSNVFSITDSEHNIYVEVDLTKKSLNANTPDGVVGVAHTSLDGKDIDDIIGVKWDESDDENNKPLDLENQINEHIERQVSFATDTIDTVFKALDRHFGKILWS